MQTFHFLFIVFLTCLILMCVCDYHLLFLILFSPTLQKWWKEVLLHNAFAWPGNLVSIATRYVLDGPGIKTHLGGGGGEIFPTHPDGPWGSPSLLYSGYQHIARSEAAGA